MTRRNGSAAILGLVVLAGIILPEACWWPWNREHSIDVASAIVLAVTAWAVIGYARDTRAQTAALSRRHIEPSLSQEQPVWAPSLGTNTIYAISSPDGSRVTALIKLKLWVGDEPVAYDGQTDAAGLHKEQSRWSVAGGQFRGVIEPGYAILQHVQKTISRGISLPELFNPDSKAAPAEFCALPENRKVRGKLLVKFPRRTELEGSQAERWHLQSSSVYCLRWQRIQRQVQSQLQDGFIWIPDPNAEASSLPPGANEW